MKKILQFAVIVGLSLLLFSCEKEEAEKEIIPQNGEWIGKYEGLNSGREDISFSIENGNITRLSVYIFFTNMTFQKTFYIDNPILNESFEYRDGEISQPGGQTIIIVNFLSETACKGSVSFNENSTNGSGTANYNFSANQNSVNSPINVADIATLRAGSTDGIIYKLTSEAILTFCTKTYNRNHKYIQDATGGILIDDKEGMISTIYNTYDGITGITGTLFNYNGMLEFVPKADPGPATSSGNIVTPQVVTIEELNLNFNNYESELVRIVGATFDDANGSNVFVYGGSVGNFNISVGSDKLIFRVHYPELDFVGDIIPSGAKNITAIAIEYNGISQIMARSKTDIVPFK